MTSIFNVLFSVVFVDKQNHSRCHLYIQAKIGHIFQDPFECLHTQYTQDLGGDLAEETMRKLNENKMELAAFIELLFSYIVMKLTVPEQDESDDYSTHP